MICSPLSSKIVAFVIGSIGLSEISMLFNDMPMEVHIGLLICPFPLAHSQPPERV
jgi:hypothetical protein